MAAEHAGFLEPQPRFVELHGDLAAAALRDVEEDDAAPDRFAQHADEPLAGGGVAGAERLEHDGPQSGRREHRPQDFFAEPRKELDDRDAVGQPLGDAQFGALVLRPEDRREVVGDVDADLGQRGVVVGAECVEVLGAALGGAVGAEQAVLEVERHLGHDGPPLVPGSGDLDGRDEVLASVGAQHADRNLAAGEDDGLGEVLEQKAQRRSGVGHGVGAVQDDEAVVAGVVVADELREGDPVGGSDVRRIDDGRHGQHVDIDVEPLERGKLVVDGAEVERHQGTRRGVGLHADGAARVDDQNRGFGSFHIMQSAISQDKVNEKFQENNPVPVVAQSPNMRSALAVVAAATCSGAIPLSSATLAQMWTR